MRLPVHPPLVALGAAAVVALLAGCSANGGGSASAGTSTGSGSSTSAPTNPTSAAASPTAGSELTSTDWRTELITPTPKPTPAVPPPGGAPGGGTPGGGLAPTAAVDPALDPQVALAKADLAGRLSMPADSITVVAATAVTWPDGALGCPQPGMSYTQVPVDGSMIVLRAGDKDYGYHAGGPKAPFLCQS